MRLVTDAERKRIDLDDGWVEVKARMPIGDIMKLLPGRALEDFSSPTPELMIAILQQTIIAWSMDEPVTPDNVELLEFTDAAEIIKQIGPILWGDAGKGQTNGTASPPASVGQES